MPNKQFGQLINTAPQSLIMLNTTNTEFWSIEVWFTDQNSEPLENTLKDNAFCYFQENLMRNMVKN